MRVDSLLPPLGEGRDGGLCIYSSSLWGEVGRGASLFLVEAMCLIWDRESGLGPTADFLSVRDRKEPSRLRGAELILRSNVSGDQKARLRRCPAKLSSLLRRSVQTAAGNMNFYVEARQSFSWRAGWHKHSALNSCSRLRERE